MDRSKSVIKTKKPSYYDLISYMKASDSKLSHNLNEAAEILNNHFGNFNFPTLVTESELFLNNHFKEIK